MIDTMTEPDLSRTLRVLGDETRLRIVELLATEELTVTELASVLALPQPRVSAHVGQLKEVLPFTERRAGRRSYLGLDLAAPRLVGLMNWIRAEGAESGLREADRVALRRVLAERDRSRGPKETAGLGSDELPGRSWEGFARALLTLVPPLRVADVGVGEGDMTLLFARFARQVVAVDLDPAALEGLQLKARRSGLTNLECRKGSIEALPLPNDAFDLVVLSQLLHLLDDPGPGLRECARVLAPGGRLLVFELARHAETWVQDRFQHRRLGFQADALSALLRDVGLERVTTSPVSRGRRSPHFVTLLATGHKPESPEGIES
ncbi:MAG: metalloregulator ArsR/SmtB family transcription factor [Planctomycetes bacterium]|nr:metalloregulator ArsR/SmtB family transcription factor [Planctomycetota bacterium]